MSFLLPNGKVSFHYSSNSIILQRKDHKSETPCSISLADLCKSVTPNKCQLNPLLFNGHLQTAWTAVKNDDVPVYYKRRAFEANDPRYKGHFEVDFVVQPYDATARKASSPGNINHDLPPRTTFFTDEEFASLPSQTDTKPML